MPHADNFQFHIMAAVAEKEREMIGQRTKAAIAAKRARGQEWGTNAARVVQADAYAEQVSKDIQALIQDDAVGPAAIARGLNERAVRTSKGGSWSSIQVQRVMRRLGMVE